MIIQLIRNAIQALRGNPDGTKEPDGKLIAILCIVAAVALIVFGMMMPKGFKPAWRMLKVFLR